MLLRLAVFSFPNTLDYSANLYFKKQINRVGWERVEGSDVVQIHKKGTGRNLIVLILLTQNIYGSNLLRNSPHFLLL